MLADVALRHVLFHHREQLPVQSILLLLQPDAFRSSMTGIYQTHVQVNRKFTLEYDIVKVWEFSIEELVSAPASIKPLAVLSHEIQTEADVSPVLGRLHDELFEELGEDLPQIKTL